MKFRDLIQLLEADGWIHARTNGSHRVYHHPVKTNSLVVAVHSPGNDVPIGTKQAILKQAGLR